MQERRPQKILDRADRTDGGQEGRRGQRSHDLVEDLLDDQPFVHAAAVADRQVDVGAGEVHQLYVRRDPDLDIGVAGPETLQPRQEPLGTEGRGDRDRDDVVLSVRGTQGVDALLQAFESIGQARQGGFRRGGRDDAAAGPSEQRRADPFLHGPYVVGDRARRHPQLLGGPTEAAQAGAGFERA